MTRGPSHSASRKVRAVVAKRMASSTLNASSDERARRSAYSTVLSGHVPLEAVVDELRQHAIEPAGVARLEQLDAAAMERAPLARRQAGVQHVVHDAAREPQARHRETRALPRSAPVRPADRSRRRRRAPARAPRDRGRRRSSRRRTRPRGCRAGRRATGRRASRPPSGSSAGRASAASPASAESVQAPVVSFTIPPESTSERTSSFVKNGLPSLPA